MTKYLKNVKRNNLKLSKEGWASVTRPLGNVQYVTLPAKLKTGTKIAIFLIEGAK